jgi:hypothetical protein
MRFSAALLALGACISATGCALGQLGALGMAGALQAATAPQVETALDVLPDDVTSDHCPPETELVVLAQNQEVGDENETSEAPPAPDEGEVFLDDARQPEVVEPRPAGIEPFKAGVGEEDIDRFSRRVTEVPLDIRPTEGAMPEDLAAAALGDTTIAAEPGPAAGRAMVPVAYSPWTICYRPLYFEEIALERYGEHWGILQPAISGAHFFGSVAALPYKMTVRPPRSCECSNGFSRCGDCPLPGYGEHVFRLDAAAVQAGIVAGIVIALP